MSGMCTFEFGVITDVKVVHSAQIGWRKMGCSVAALYAGTAMSKYKASNRSGLMRGCGALVGSRYLGSIMRTGEEKCIARNANVTTLLNAATDWWRSEREPKRLFQILRSMTDANAVVREKIVLCGLRRVQSKCDSRRRRTLGNSAPERRERMDSPCRQ